MNHLHWYTFQPKLSYCLQILRMPLFQLPQLISQLVNAQVAITRLREFLAAAEQHTMPETEAAGPGQLLSDCFLLIACERAVSLSALICTHGQSCWLAGTCRAFLLHQISRKWLHCCMHVRCCLDVGKQQQRLLGGQCQYTLDSCGPSGLGPIPV